MIMEILYSYKNHLFYNHPQVPHTQREKSNFIRLEILKLKFF